MDKVVIDAEFRSKLNFALGSVELCDEAGNTVAHAVHPELYERLLYAWAREEFDREERENPDTGDELEGSLTTAEVLEHLARLDRDASGAA